ncbi:MAG: hypothetical protein Q9162_007029 [Coniocarpon cinnabarinum]
MKLVYSCIASVLASGAVAFPTLNWENVRARQTDGNQGGVDIPCTPVQPAFDAQAQYVSNTGKYVASITDLIQGTYDVFGMAQDLSGFLAVYGAIFDGNLQGYSIGGPSVNEPALSGLLGTPQGLSGSHNKYENDASPIRGDLYLFGNDYENQVSQFQQFYDLENGKSDEDANYGLNDIEAFRVTRFQDSIDNNPYFFNAPFSGAIASPAAYTFIYRFMANKSEEHPEGRLDRNTLMHFYSMTGESGNFQYTPGYESIPDNWYKRNPDDDYTIPYFTCDALNQIKDHPQFASIGGNVGKTNSFVGLDPADITGGAYHAEDFTTSPDAFPCFAFQLLQESAPDLLEGILTDVTPAVNQLSDAISSAIAAGGFDCPQIKNLQYGQFGQFPGYTQSYNGYQPNGVLGGLLGGIL